MDSKYTGKYTKAFLTDKKVEKESTEANIYNSLIKVNDQEMVYIYSFKGNELLFAKGYNKFLNIPDEEIDIIKLNSLFDEFYEEFVFEYHDRLLLYLLNNNKNLDEFSSHCIIKSKGLDTNIMLKIRVFKTDDNGNLISIIGRNIIDKELKSSDIIQYALNGSIDQNTKDVINNDLDFPNCISLQSIHMIEALEAGKSKTEISNILNLEESQIIINLNKLLSRFKLKNEDELIEFAKKKYLIPNQFENYINQ